MECRPFLWGQKQALRTPPSSLSGLEMRSAECDGPNGIHYLPGPGLVPPGNRSLAPQLPSSTKHDGFPVPSKFGSFFGHQCCLTAAARTSHSASRSFYLGGWVRRVGSRNARRRIKGAEVRPAVSWTGSGKHKGTVLSLDWSGVEICWSDGKCENGSSHQHGRYLA